MTNEGGKNFSGTVFKVTTTGTLTILSHLNGATLGNEPQENLVAGKGQRPVWYEPLWWHL